MPRMSESFLALRMLLAEVDRLRASDRVAVHDAQRIVASGPCAAWRARARCRRPRRRCGPRPLRARQRARSAHRRCRCARSSLPPDVSMQPQAAERQRGRWRSGVAVDVDQLEAAAAEVAGDAVGVRKPIRMPLAASSASRCAGQHLDRAPSACSPRAMKSGPSEASRTAAVAMARTFLTPRMRVIAWKRRQRLERALDASAPSRPVEATGAAEAAQHLLVEERRRAAHRALVDDEAHRVGPDIDDADRLELAAAASSSVVLCASRRLHASASALLVLEAEARREAVLQRLSAPRQARVGHEVLVRVERLLARGRLDALRGAIRHACASSAGCPSGSQP